MNGPSFLKRLVRSVVGPGERRSARHAIELCRALLSERGEVSLAALAREALAAYNALPEAALPVFFDLLVAKFAPDPATLDEAYAAYRAQPTQDHLIRLHRCVEAPRHELFRRLNTAPGGTGAIVAMRRYVLGALNTHPEWKGIDADRAPLRVVVQPRLSHARAYRLVYACNRAREADRIRGRA